MQKISEFYAALGFKVDTKGLDRFNMQLAAMSKLLRTVENEAKATAAALDSVNKIKLGAIKLSNTKSNQTAAKAVGNLNNSAQTGTAKIMTYTGKINRLANAMARLADESARVNLPTGSIRLRGEGRNRQGGIQRTPFGGGGFNMFGGGNAFIRQILPFAGASLAASAIVAGVRAGRSLFGAEVTVGAVSGRNKESNLQFMNDVADRLGMPLLETADQYAKILAAAQGTKLEGNPVNELFSSVMEFGKARMIDPNRISLAIRALGQMMNKQVVMAEEIKNQFGEHLPGAMKLAAEANGQTVQEFLKSVEAGEVLADEFLPKLAKVMKQVAREGGALEEALRDSGVQQIKFTNTITRYVGQVYKVFNFQLGTVFKNLAEIVSKLDPQLLGNFIKNLLFAVELFVIGLGSVILVLQEAYRHLGFLLAVLVPLGAYLAYVKAGVLAVSIGLGNIAGKLGFLAPVLKAVRFIFSGVAIAVVGFSAVLEDLFGWIQGSESVFKNWWSFIVWFWTSVFDFLFSGINKIKALLGFGEDSSESKVPSSADSRKPRGASAATISANIEGVSQRTRGSVANNIRNNNSNINQNITTEIHVAGNLDEAAGRQVVEGVKGAVTLAPQIM